MASTLTSRLVMELVDRVSGPSRRLSESLLGINRSMQTLNGQRTSFSSRLGDAIERNNAALDNARGHLVDAVAGFYALKGALTAPIASAMELETALNAIGSKAGLTAEQLQGVLGAAKDASKGSNQYTADILKSVDYLVGMGMSAEDAQTAIETIGRASTATGAEILEMSQAGYAAIANLKVPADQVGMALDAMALAGKRGGFELKDMAQYFPQVGAAYQALGQSGTGAVADLSAAMQVMRKDTGDASTAATNLQNVIQKTFAPGTVKKFADKGVDIFKSMEAAAARGLTPLEAIAEITNETLDGDLTKLGFLFEDAQAQAGIRSLIQNMDEFRAIRAEAMAGAGTNEADFNRAMQTTAQRLKAAQIAVSNLGATIGSALLPAILTITEFLTPIIEKLGQWAEANPALTAGIIGVTSAVIGLRIAMSALAYVGLMGRGGVLGAISIGATMLGNTVGPLWAAARASIALQTALGAMAGGQTLSVFATLATGLRGALFAIPGVSALASGIAAIGAAVATISAPVWITFAAVAAAVAAAGLTIWKYWDRITAVLSGVGQAIGEILAPALDAIRPVLNWFAPLGNVIAAGWERATAAISAVGSWLSSVFTQETLSEEDAAKAKQAGYDFIMALWNGMKQVMADLTGWLGSKIDGMVQSATDALNSLAEWSGMSGGDTAPATAPNRADVINGERAKGGPISRGSRYLVGEEGPEVITASRSGYVNKAGSAGGGGATINFGGITVNAAQGMSPQDVAHAVRREIENASRELFRGIYADSGMRFT